MFETGIHNCIIEPQPIFGDETGGVLHLLPGGSSSSSWFGGEVLDVYGFFASGDSPRRGGHYHPKLNEMFIVLSGAALWVLSDFRPGSPTYKKTTALVLAENTPAETFGLPCFAWRTDRSVPRLRVPAGVYHAVFPIDEHGFTCLALGTTPYDKSDYVYPPDAEVPNLLLITSKFKM